VVWYIQDISSLSAYDYICIVAEFNQATGNGTIAEDDLVSRGYTPEAIAGLRRAQGKPENQFESCGVRFSTSIANFAYPGLYKLLTVHEYMEKGVMPFAPNAVLEQPAQIMEMVALIQNLKMEHQKKNSKGK
jgi:hypothetical protein